MVPSRKMALAFLASTAVAAAAFAQPVAEGGRKFVTALTGQAELTGGALVADMDGSGTAHVVVNHGQRRVCWDLVNLQNLDTLSAAHIHRGTAVESGGIVVTFFHFGQPIDLEGCTTAPLSRELLKEIIQHPERFYVNVHTTVFPGGAIRGQLGK